MNLCTFARIHTKASRVSANSYNTLYWIHSNWSRLVRKTISTSLKKHVQINAKHNTLCSTSSLTTVNIILAINKPVKTCWMFRRFTFETAKSCARSRSQIGSSLDVRELLERTPTRTVRTLLMNLSFWASVLWNSLQTCLCYSCSRLCIIAHAFLVWTLLRRREGLDMIISTKSQ